jgi:hypothetical protein
MNGFSRRAVRQPLLEKREKWRTPAKLIVRAVWFPPLRKRRARMGHPRPVLEKREKWRTPANAHCAGSVVPTLAQRTRKDGAPSAGRLGRRSTARGQECPRHTCKSPALWNIERGFRVAFGVSRTGMSAPHGLSTFRPCRRRGRRELELPSFPECPLPGLRWSTSALRSNRRWSVRCAPPWSDRARPP